MKLKKSIKNNLKNDLNKPGLTRQTRDSYYETRIT
jgi:hypothetical protein